MTPPILGGRKEKIRPGDVLGVRTKDLGFEGTQTWKVNVAGFSTEMADHAPRALNGRRVKGTSAPARRLVSRASWDRSRDQM